MKQQVLAAVAAFLLLSVAPQCAGAQTSAGQSAQPQAAQAEGAPYTSAISADPIYLLWGQFVASYEHKLSENNSFVVFGSYWGWLDWSAYGFGASYRWYFDVSSVSKMNKQALEGFSVGPLASVGFWSWKGSQYWDAVLGQYANYSGGTSFQIGASAAYKWIFSGGWFVEPTVAVTFNVGSINGFSGYNPFELGGNIGYAWK